MEHIAILKKSWRFLPKILNGEKTIESRWYRLKTVPWNRIRPGETVYFKESGEAVKAKAEVAKVVQISGLTPEKVGEIIHEYGSRLGIPDGEAPKFIQNFGDKQYCLLIFLKNPQAIEPFEIDKTGYGAMSAWLTLEDVGRIMRG